MNGTNVPVRTYSRPPDYRDKQKLVFKNWYNNLTPEQKAERYVRKRERELSDPKYAETRRQYLEKNKVLLQAKTQTSRCMKHYPNSITVNSPTVEQLVEYITSKQGCPCRYCGQPSSSVDHVTPLARGGLHVIENLEMTCLTCNIAKKDRTHDEFVDWIIKAANYLHEGELNNGN